MRRLKNIIRKKLGKIVSGFRGFSKAITDFMFLFYSDCLKSWMISLCEETTTSARPRSLLVLEVVIPMQYIPAFLAAIMPFGESSITQQSSELISSFSAAYKKIAGSGLDLLPTSEILKIYWPKILDKPNFLSAASSKWL